MSFFRKIGVISFPRYTWPLLALLLLAVLTVVNLPPRALPASLYLGSPLKGLTVALDPGHGGIDSGTHFQSVLLEKEIVLEIGLQLQRLLEQAGARVMITRVKDEELSYHFPDDSLPRHRRDIRGRVKLINESRADLMISLHVNSIHDPGVRGPIAFYRTGDHASKHLAAAVHAAINPLFSADAKPGQLIHQNPQESNVYFILNETAMPGIILEVAFMTNADDRRMLEDSSTRHEIARAIFLGVIEYLYREAEPDNETP
ncbi:MAG: N-acetylmuramoyl-L-alanine amidase [Firmicutes bacterium]|nr:N-acetylmuramoyl-L-alanine amidase [Bacillota bacterium]